jgi:glycosyltransferase involved in cell wall biosynthesis
MSLELSILIPAFNDQSGLELLLPQLLPAAQALNIPFEVIVIDDGSSTPLGLGSFAQGPVRVTRHSRNRGYGAAIKTGIRQASGKYILIMDADNQHDPKHLGAFYERVQTCDMVVGMRSHYNASPLWRRPGRFLLRLLFNSMAPYPIKDINCGYRCARRDIIRKFMSFCSDGFSFSISSSMILMGRGYNVDFIDVEVRKRLGSPSTVKISTGLQTLILIIRLVVLTNPLRFFLPISLFFIFLGSAWSIPYALQGKGISVGAEFLWITGLLTFFFGVIADQISGLIKSNE